MTKTEKIEVGNKKQIAAEAVFQNETVYSSGSGTDQTEPQNISHMGTLHASPKFQLSPW